jgi:hypothetical protein
MMSKLLGRSRSLIYRWIREAALDMLKPAISENITEIEFDEMRHFIESKKKHWLIKAVDRSSWKTIAWVLGGRDSATFRRLYEKVKHL